MRPLIPSLVAARGQMLTSLRIPNYRTYFIGQAISRAGTWMQRFAQSWLVYDLSGNATIVGVTVALQAAPALLFGPYGGVITDRFDKRRMMIALQAMMAGLAVVLGMLTVTHAVRLWEVLLLAFLLGINETFEMPARQVFIFELVGGEHLPNAVALNSVLNSIARAVGPAIGAGLVASVGLGSCFLLNAASFGAVIASLMLIDLSALFPAQLTARGRGQLRAGLSYVRRSPNLWVPLVMMSIIGMLTWEFQTVLPAMASQALHGGATAYGFLIAAQGAGSFFGGLTVAATRRTGTKTLTAQAVAFGLAMSLAAVAPNLWIAMAFMLVVGFTSTRFSTTGNATIQLNSDRHMRGRVMSLWLVAFQGTTPIGGPLAGFVAHTAGARVAMGMGAAACFVAAALAAGVRARHRKAVVAVPASTTDDETPTLDEAISVSVEEESS